MKRETSLAKKRANNAQKKSRHCLKGPLALLVFLLSLWALPVSAMDDPTTIRVGVAADPVSLDPHAKLSGATLEYSHTVFDPLLRWRPDMTFEGRLATKWERQDPLTLRFWLRKGVTFHSGNPFTAKDVAWTVRRLKKSVDFKGLFKPIKEVRIIDDYTLDVITETPTPLLKNICVFIFPMDRLFYSGTDASGQPKDTLKKSGPSFALTHASGTGPFRVAYREHGVKTIYERFANHWDNASPGNVQRIILTPIKNNAVRVASLLSGDTDFIYPVSPQDFAQIAESKRAKLVTQTGTRVIMLQMNQARRPEFRDRRVRQAMVYAINNTGIVSQIMKGFATPAGQQGPKGYTGYKATLTPRFDLEKARSLMAEAGHPNGFHLSMIAPSNRYINDARIAEAVVNMLAKIGITVDLKTMPKALYWEAFDAQSADVQMIGWHASTMDSANFNEYLNTCPDRERGLGLYNSSHYCNPKVDALTLACQSETDLQKRSAMLQEIEEILYDDAAFIPLHWQNLSWAASHNIAIEKIINFMNTPFFGDLVVY